MTDAGLHCLGQCQGLRALGLTSTNRVSDAGLACLLQKQGKGQYCSLLQYLDVSGCRHLTAATAELLCNPSALPPSLRAVLLPDGLRQLPCVRGCPTAVERLVFPRFFWPNPCAADPLAPPAFFS